MLKQNTFKSWLAKSIIIALVAAAFASDGNSQQSDPVGLGGRRNATMPEYIQEFLLSEAVRSQDKGELQVTFALDSRQKIGTSVATRMEYGLTGRLQVSLDVAYGITASQDAEIPARWSSTTVGLLFQIIRSDRPFALSVGMAFGLPTGSRGDPTYEPSILAAKTFRKLQIHASFFSDVEQWKPAFEYNVAGVYPLTRHWFPTFEFNGRREKAKNAFYLTPGVYRHFKRRIELGIGIPVGVGGVAGAVGIVTKMNWEVGGDH